MIMAMVGQFQRPSLPPEQKFLLEHGFLYANLYYNISFHLHGITTKDLLMVMGSTIGTEHF